MKLLEQYRRDGYVIVRNFVDMQGDSSEDLFVFLQRVFHTSPSNFKSLLAHRSREFEIYELFINNKMRAFLRRLGLEHVSMPTGPVFHVLSHALRLHDGYFGTAPHQDWSSTQGSLDSLTVWIPFTPTRNNFPLEVIRQSHLNGLLPGKLNGSVLEVEANNEDFIALDCHAGDAVFMSAFLVHRTGNGGDEMRTAVSMRFDNVAEKSFANRWFPCAQKRTVDREIKWSPTVEEVRKVFHVVD